MVLHSHDPLLQDTNWYSDIYTGAYYLESSIHIRNGATLSIDGSEDETDECETLYLVSGQAFQPNSFCATREGWLMCYVW